MVNQFEKITTTLFCETFPERTITISPDDQPFFNEQLRKLKRLRMREYNRHGRSEKYLKLRSNFDEKFKLELAKYKNKIQLEVTEGSEVAAIRPLKGWL